MATSSSDQPNSQTSPFLRFPAEIRNRIYQFALVSPTPIDLCPAAYAHGVDDAKRYSTQSPQCKLFSCPRLMEELSQRPCEHDESFRLQKDLLFVRKELAVGLLSTCRQVYCEAVDFFWTHNQWQFSDDEEWKILLRFLLTIGPNARARIRKLDVFAPFATNPMEGHSLALNSNPCKNHPRLHLVTVPIYPAKCAYRHQVYDILMCEERIEQINFIVPRGYCVYEVDDDEVPPRFLPKIVVNIESGGFINEDLTVEYFTDRGWDVSAPPDEDDDWMEPFVQRALINQSNETKTWKGNPDAPCEAAQACEGGA